jgi:phenylalanyl-tRNA synthetase beta chain
VLRTTLLGGLLENTEWNKNRGEEGVHLFEIGNIYYGSDESTCERLFLGLTSTGPLGAPHWKSKPGRAADVFHIKGALEAAMDGLRYAPYSFEAEDYACFESGSCLALIYKGQKIGRLGLVNRRLQALYSLKDPTFAAEVDLELLYSKQPRPFEYVPLPKFPAVSRDISFLVDRNVPYQEIKQAIDKLALPYLEEFTVIDCYAGEPVPPLKKSLLIRFVYRNSKGTLLTEDANRAEQKIIKILKSAFEIELREGGGKR